MIKHFVTFYSPGTFFAETTTKPIEKWDVDTAIEMSREIKERYGASPYGFQFSTRERGEGDLDSHEIKRSGTYYLGGQILTVRDLETEGDPKNKTLISNMKCNGWRRVIRNDNSWRWVQPLYRGDKVLNIPSMIQNEVTP